MFCRHGKDLAINRCTDQTIFTEMTTQNHRYGTNNTAENVHEYMREMAIECVEFSGQM